MSPRCDDVSARVSASPIRFRKRLRLAHCTGTDKLRGHAWLGATHWLANAWCRHGYPRLTSNLCSQAAADSSRAEAAAKAEGTAHAYEAKRLRAEVSLLEEQVQALKRAGNAQADLQAQLEQQRQVNQQLRRDLKEAQAQLKPPSQGAAGAR